MILKNLLRNYLNQFNFDFESCYIFNKQSCTEIYMQALILTGVVAGFVHVVSGVDHLIAMVPAAINLSLIHI